MKTKKNSIEVTNEKEGGAGKDHEGNFFFFFLFHTEVPVWMPHLLVAAWQLPQNEKEFPQKPHGEQNLVIIIKCHRKQTSPFQ